jgi:predicted TIM-barrel fold metal-dependent hydrolase
MKLDINTALGHWPFRRVPHQTADALRARLRGAGIDRAAVANTHGLFYKNCQDANLELAEWIAPHREFYLGVATLNPTYAAWERDLAACAGELGFRALRMAPQYHAYVLQGGPATDMARAAADLDLPLLIPHRVVDVRQRHGFDTERTIDLDEIGALCEAVPEAQVVVTEGRFPAPALIEEGGAPRYPNLYLESSRAGIDPYPEPFAAERILFGTGSPFKHVTPALLKVEIANLKPESRARIYGGNARTLLGI